MDKIPNQPFFVYGTLLPGQPNAFLWGDSVLGQEVALFRNGRLYDLGHYPMLIEGEGGPIQGMLMQVKAEQYADIVARLDYLEGYDAEQHDSCAYQRVTREIWLVNGRSTTAWLYLGQAPFVAGFPSLAEGDWAAYVAAADKQTKDWWASVKTVSGLLD